MKIANHVCSVFFAGLLLILAYNCKPGSTTPEPILSQATVTTTAATGVTTTGATLGGNVTGDGNAAVSERGVVYATTQTPTTANTKVAVGTGTGSFTTNVTGLTAGTTYYVRAYAINSQGTAYGSQETFTCSLALSLPTVTTTPASNITSTGATLGGNVTADGNASVTEKGVVYATTANPTTANTKVVVGTGGTGSFTTNITGLTPGSTYYVRAYAINSQGTAYGLQESFTCSLTLSIPTVSTTPAASITSTGATLGGNVTSDGNATVSEKGVVYATTANPTTSNTKVVVGTGGTGSFTTNLTGLAAGTIYYIRAYAINSQGTAYGSQVTFTTPSNQLPTASDYYLYLRVGNYLKFSGWDRTTIYKILRSGTINGETYYLQEGSEIMDNKPNETSAFQYLWLRKDLNGNILIAAYDPDLSSAIIFDPPVLWFPNQNLTLGYSRTFDLGSGVTSTESVISISATVGIYTNCIQVRSTQKTYGIVTMIEDTYYAYHVGYVKFERSFPTSQIHVLNIIDYVNTP